MTLRHREVFIWCRRIGCRVGGGLLFRWVDPDGGWQLGWPRDFAFEALVLPQNLWVAGVFIRGS